ncbi:hypothetical protein [Virgibacillus sp. SK37]|uniref:hypothetical protein n=1 Tax=Virgibacillus sp. SK37 TaxID=403957 RepID=UPI0004D0E54C|nr:hypothetical protein [Virgibacillus sp. SK37]AIF45671.1 hypothetical protein X953_18965 [Virgibacillus sp. SK37]
MANKFIVYLEQKGLAGMEDIFDSGWGYCLPSAPYRLYEVLKRTQGNQNTESWNGYKRIRMQSRLDNPSISTSIQFLTLLNFITYKTGRVAQISNRYSVTDFVNILALQEVPALEHLLKVVKRVRQASSKEKQVSKFSKPVEKMENIIERFSNGSIEKIPTELREKELMDGTTRVVRGIGGDANYFERYEDTLKEIMNFLEALYSVLRNGNNVPVAECKNNCKKDKCKCVEEITSEDSLLHFLMNNKSCESQQGSSESQQDTSESQQGSSESQDDNKIYNNMNNKNQNLDDDNFKKPSPETGKTISENTKKLLFTLKIELTFFFGKEEMQDLNRLVDKQAANLSICEIEDCINIVKLFKKEGYPISKPTAYFENVFKNPKFKQAENTVKDWKLKSKQAAKEAQRDVMREAGKAISREDSARIFANLSKIDHKYEVSDDNLTY